MSLVRVHEGDCMDTRLDSTCTTLSYNIIIIIILDLIDYAIHFSKQVPVQIYLH